MIFDVRQYDCRRRDVPDADFNLSEVSRYSLREAMKGSNLPLGWSRRNKPVYDRLIAYTLIPSILITVCCPCGIIVLSRVSLCADPSLVNSIPLSHVDMRRLIPKIYYIYFYVPYEISTMRNIYTSIRNGGMISTYLCEGKNVSKDVVRSLKIPKNCLLAIFVA